ncbi:MAG TPA: DUF3344 domain-containing protein, partial [Methanosarcinales archaeon]|nr:DUF3344 domain-containing protein [Methanosarcinales archaeon]
MKTGTKTVIGLMSALLLCAMAAPALAQPDLIVTDIGPDYIFADLTNVQSAQVKNTDLSYDAAAFSVSISITDGSSTELYSNKVNVAGLLANTSVSVSLGNWKPTSVENITITVVADCDDDIFESDENNNASIEQRTTTGDCDTDTMSPATCYGYRGQYPLQGIYSDAGKHGLIYTTGDYKYKNETVNFDIGTDNNEIAGTTSDIPVGATIKHARLYEYFCWRKSETGPNPGPDPRPDFELSFNGNPLTADAYYTDMKGFKASEYQYGTLAYDVTAYVTGNGAYQAARSNYVYGKGYTSGMALLIVYGHPTNPYVEYHINEGYDRLATEYGTQYHVLPEDATTSASFPCIDNPVEEIVGTTLFTATLDTNGANEALDFNDGGPWVPVWYGTSDYPIGTDSRSVTSELQLNPFCNPEVTEFTEDGSGFGATNAILIVEKESLPNNVYLVPQHSGASYCNTTVVEVYAETTDLFQGGSIKLSYTPGCANVTDVEYNPMWDLTATWGSDTDGYEWLVFARKATSGSVNGLAHICNLTIHYECDVYCMTPLHFVSEAEDPSYYCMLSDDVGSEVTPVAWHDGTFKCTNLPDLVITDLYGEQQGTGNDYIVHYIVKNEGNAPVAAGHTTTLHIGELATPGTWTWIEDMTVPDALAPGDSYTGTFATVLTMTTPNDLLKVCADSFDDVMEIDEENNCMESFYPAGIEIKVDVLDDGECVDFQEQFLVNIDVDPRNIPVYGVQYTLSFNNSVLHAEWQNEGTFLNGDGEPTNVYINNIDNGAGTIS